MDRRRASKHFVEANGAPRRLNHCDVALTTTVTLVRQPAVDVCCGDMRIWQTYLFLLGCCDPTCLTFLLDLCYVLCSMFDNRTLPHSDIGLPVGLTASFRYIFSPWMRFTRFSKKENSIVCKLVLDTWLFFPRVILNNHVNVLYKEYRTECHKIHCVELVFSC